MVAVGDKWGAVECIEVGRITTNVYADDADGNKYVAETRTQNGYKLQCTCGNVFDVVAVRFRGKKAHRDCGCGRAGFSGHYVVMAFSTNTGIKSHVQELAKLDGHGNASLIVNTALREYFERREQNTTTAEQRQETEQLDWSSKGDGHATR